MVGLIRRNQLGSFFVLAFILSWYPWALGALGVVPGAKGMNPLGVLVAGLLVSAIVGRWPGTRAYLARIVRAQVHPFNYLIAVGVPVAACLITLAIHLMLGAPWPARSALAKWPELAGSFVFILLFIGLGEEPGWRGFALPRLQERFTPLRASMILALVWAVWHFPLLRTEILPAFMAPFIANVIAATFFLTWLFNRSRGSVLMPMLAHASVNTVSSGFLFTLYPASDLPRLWWIYACVWACTALLLVLRTRGALGNNSSAMKLIVPAALR